MERTDDEVIGRVSGDIFCSGTCHETASEEENLFLRSNGFSKCAGGAADRGSNVLLLLYKSSAELWKHKSSCMDIGIVVTSV